jgi:hypothetical protein
MVCSRSLTKPYCLLPNASSPVCWNFSLLVNSSGRIVFRGLGVGHRNHGLVEGYLRSVAVRNQRFVNSTMLGGEVLLGGILNTERTTDAADD